MNKQQLIKIWKQLDGAMEALERLDENGFDVVEDYRIDSSAINNLKNDVESTIRKKARNQESLNEVLK